jgi:hypothetical protein
MIRMRLCVIKVAGFSYMARFPSTCAALADALKRFPRATTVSVRSSADNSAAATALTC